jgi:hypothetical protein
MAGMLATLAFFAKVSVQNLHFHMVYPEAFNLQNTTLKTLTNPYTGRLLAEHKPNSPRPLYPLISKAMRPELSWMSRATHGS